MDAKTAPTIVPNVPFDVDGREQRLWSHEEDEVLRRLIGINGEDDLRFVDWRAVIQVLPWRTAQQCRGRWRRLRHAALAIAGARGFEHRKPTNKCTLCGAIRIGHACPYLKKAAETPQTLLNRKKIKKALPAEPEVVVLNAFVAWKSPTHAEIAEDVDWVFGAVFE